MPAEAWKEENWDTIPHPQVGDNRKISRIPTIPAIPHEDWQQSSYIHDVHP